MRQISKRFYIITTIFIALFISSCNGYVSQQYYKKFSNGELSKSLKSQYEEKYSKKWKEYRKNGTVKTSEELFAREDYINIKNYYKYKTSSWGLESKDRDSKNYCVYSLSYFAPINFWNLRFTDNQYIKKTIKDLNKNGKNMQHIKIDRHGFGSPIYSFSCTKVSGEIAGGD